jgi:hypothetical protein
MIENEARDTSTGRPSPAGLPKGHPSYAILFTAYVIW